MSMPAGIGVVDLQTGFPHSSVAAKKATYDFFRANLKDRESLEEMEFPAEYMFKGVPDLVPEGTDVVAWTMAKMDEYGVAIGMGSLTPTGIEARRRHPDRIVLQISVNPHEGVDALRKMEAAKSEYDIVGAMCFPSGQTPQVAIDDKKMYPIYSKCIELDIAMCVNVGIVGPRMPSWPQHAERIDEICYDFPELRLVMMHGAEPWTALAAKLMLKWPGLHYMTSAFAPKHYPKDIIDYANTRGADKVMYCGYPAGLTYERQFRELPLVPFKEHVWPKFLRENAMRVFKIQDALDRFAQQVGEDLSHS
jgi:predicted TIM-barrel fold metal-dependent hydrolase